MRLIKKQTWLSNCPVAAKHVRLFTGMGKMSLLAEHATIGSRRMDCEGACGNISNSSLIQEQTANILVQLERNAIVLSLSDSVG